MRGPSVDDPCPDPACDLETCPACMGVGFLDDERPCMVCDHTGVAFRSEIIAWAEDEARDVADAARREVRRA